ncbi:MAG: MarR family winged helix-turn-helix transcriptional regulator [Candidatus Zixiibacteriota bacterium]
MSTLDKSIGFLVARTARSMKRALDAKLVDSNITSTQYIVLQCLWDEDGLPLSELGHRLYFDNPTITGIVDRMEKVSLVARSRDTSDRRVVRIYLAKEGKRLKASLPKIAEEINDTAVAGWSKSEIEQFIASLDSIWERMNSSING